MTFIITCVVFLVFCAGFGYGRRRRNRFSSRPKVYNPQVQLNLVHSESFRKQPLFNKVEKRIFYALKDALRNEFGNSYLLFAQVCVGEFLKCERDDAHSAINSKRVDFLVTDTNGIPILAIEHHGGGHFQGTASVRDEVKRRAFRSAKLELYEITEDVKKEVFQRVMIDRIRETFSAH